MKKIVKLTAFIGCCIVSVLLLGLLTPLFLSSFVVLFTEVTYRDCLIAFPFWILTVIGWIIFANVMLESLEKPKQSI